MKKIINLNPSLQLKFEHAGKRFLYFGNFAEGFKT